MSELQNIDKLLKESFSDFAPDAPNVWQGVEQGVQAAQAGHAAGVAGAVKGGMGIAAKIVAAVAVSASLVTGYILLSDKKEEAPGTKQVTTAHNTTATETPVQVVPEEPAKVTPETATVTERPATHSIHPSHTAADSKTTTSSSQQMIGPAPVTVQNTPKAETIIEPLKKEETQAATTTPAVSSTSKASTPDVPAKPTNTPSETVVKNSEPQAQKEIPVNTDSDREMYDEPVIPGSFSPNGDGINDRFVILIDHEAVYALTMQDLKGNIVFESDNKSNTWDGKDSKTGMACGQGAYYYVFNYQFKGSQQSHKKTGIIKLF